MSDINPWDAAKDFRIAISILASANLVPVCDHHPEHMMPDTTYNNHTIDVRKKKTGWAMTVRNWTTQPFAVYVDGTVLCTASGAIRTFGSRQAAQKAAELYIDTPEAEGGFLEGKRREGRWSDL